MRITFTRGLALAAVLATSSAAFAARGGSFAAVLAGAQVVGLALHGLSRNRRLWDALLFAGLGFGFLVSLLPFLLLASGGRVIGTLVRLLAAGDLFALSPFGFGLPRPCTPGAGSWARSRSTPRQGSSPWRPCWRSRRR